MITKYAVQVLTEETGIPVYVGPVDDWLHPLIPTFTSEIKYYCHFRAAYALANFLKRTYSHVMVVACNG